MTLSAGTRLGPYEILSPLGAGGMGEVYRAKDTTLGRDAAIKVLPDGVAQDAERLARSEREARALAALNHPGIVTIYSVEQSGDGLRKAGLNVPEPVLMIGCPSRRGRMRPRFPAVDARAPGPATGPVLHRQVVSFAPRNFLISQNDVNRAQTKGASCACARRWVRWSRPLRAVRFGT